MNKGNFSFELPADLTSTHAASSPPAASSVSVPSKSYQPTRAIYCDGSNRPVESFAYAFVVDSNRVDLLSMESIQSLLAPIFNFPVVEFRANSSSVLRHALKIKKSGCNPQYAHNVAELVALTAAVKYALSNGITNTIFIDSKIVRNSWSTGRANSKTTKNMSTDIRRILSVCVELCSQFRAAGGSILSVSGDDNPADPGLHIPKTFPDNGKIRAKRTSNEAITSDDDCSTPAMNSDLDGTSVHSMETDRGSDMDIDHDEEQSQVNIYETFRNQCMFCKMSFPDGGQTTLHLNVFHQALKNDDIPFPLSQSPYTKCSSCCKWITRTRKGTMRQHKGCSGTHKRSKLNPSSIPQGTSTFVAGLAPIFSSPSRAPAPTSVPSSYRHMSPSGDIHRVGNRPASNSRGDSAVSDIPSNGNRPAPHSPSIRPGRAASEIRDSGSRNVPGINAGSGVGRTAVPGQGIGSGNSSSRPSAPGPGISSTGNGRPSSLGPRVGSGTKGSCPPVPGRGNGTGTVDTGAGSCPAPSGSIGNGIHSSGSHTAAPGPASSNPSCLPHQLQLDLFESALLDLFRKAISTCF
jgi:hypothetical protein